jgi:hypothetical protein
MANWQIHNYTGTQSIWFPDLVYIGKFFSDEHDKLVVRIHCDGEVLDYCRWQHFDQVLDWTYIRESNGYRLTITEELWTLMILKFGDKIYGPAK